MLKVILQILLAVLFLRLLGSLFGLFRGGKKRAATFERSGASNPVEEPDYSDITPYEIEDAEYEEIPKKK